ncbi:MAG: pyridoxal phosphate-dependent aminotransferase [Candidatus Thorarchaeota archaeon]
MRIRLNLNENPYPPPSEVLKAGKKGLSLLNRYNFPEDRTLLQQLLADYSGVPRDYIITYPGSDLILREIVHMFSRDRKVIMVFPTFLPTFYAAQQSATNLSIIPLKPPNFVLNTKKLLDELNEPTLIIIDNPNNPTGKIILDRNIVETILNYDNVRLVIDEAYFEFTKVTHADLVEEYPNLAIGRTISKAFGLAGVRIGYIIGGKTFLDKFSSVSIMLSQVGLYTAIEAIKNPGYIEKNIDLIQKERDRVSSEIKGMGLEVYPSTTNFLLINTKIDDIGKKLLEREIFILDLSDRWLPGFIRVAIGSKKENDAFLTNMKEIV